MAIAGSRSTGDWVSEVLSISVRKSCICTGFVRSMPTSPGFLMAIPIMLGNIAVGTSGASFCAIPLSSVIKASTLVDSTVTAGPAFARGAVAIAAIIVRDNIIDFTGMFFIVFFLNVSLCSMQQIVIEQIISFVTEKSK